MERPLAGRVILIVEDEPLIAIDMRNSFEGAGATTIAVQTLAAALVAVEQPNLSAAVVDHALGDGDSSELCSRLDQRGVPFITYSGHAHISGVCAKAEHHVGKPARTGELVATVTGLLASHATPN